MTNGRVRARRVGPETRTTLQMTPGAPADPTGPVFAGDYMAARGSASVPSPKGMILAAVAILAVDAVAISAWAAVSAGPSPVGGSGIVAGQEAGLSVPQPP